MRKMLASLWGIWKMALTCGLLALAAQSAAAQAVKVDQSFQVVGAGPKVQVRDQLMDAFTFYLRAEEANGATRVCGSFTGIEFLLVKRDWAQIVISANGQAIAPGSFLANAVTHHHPTAVATKSPLGRRSHIGRRAKCATSNVPWQLAFATAPLQVSLPDKAYQTCNGRRQGCVLTIQ